MPIGVEQDPRARQDVGRPGRGREEALRWAGVRAGERHETVPTVRQRRRRDYY